MLPSWETSFYLSTRKGAYQQKIFAHVTDPSCVWKQYTLRYSTFFAQISHCSMKGCSNTSWTYSTSTFTVSEWRVAEAKWLFSVHFVWKNTDFPLCPCGFWGFCYHGVITDLSFINDNSLIIKFSYSIPFLLENSYFIKIISSSKFKSTAGNILCI